MSNLVESYGQDTFAFHSNTRNYIKRRDPPAAAQADSVQINFSTEWKKCEYGIVTESYGT
jgi:hypothetical protein